MTTTNKQAPAAAFYVNTAPVKWPVTVRQPIDGGEFADFQFVGHFMRVSDEEWFALEKSDESAKLSENATYAERDAVTLRDNLRNIPTLMVGWEGVRRGPEPDSSEVPFSVELLQRQLSGPNARALATGIWRALQEIRLGLRLGNSAPLPAPGLGDAPAAEGAQTL